MLEITRELVEHYLRATGWSCLARDPMVFRSANAEYDIVLPNDSMPRSIQYIASASKAPRHVVAFRLGLCAAAESLLLWASEWQLEKEEYRPGDVIDERGIGLLREAAERQLTTAGIDPAAWESARKR